MGKSVRFESSVGSRFREKSKGPRLVLVIGKVGAGVDSTAAMWSGHIVRCGSGRNGDIWRKAAHWTLPIRRTILQNLEHFNLLYNALKALGCWGHWSNNRSALAWCTNTFIASEHL